MPFDLDISNLQLNPSYLYNYRYFAVGISASTVSIFWSIWDTYASGTIVLGLSKAALLHSWPGRLRYGLSESWLNIHSLFLPPSEFFLVSPISHSQLDAWGPGPGWCSLFLCTSQLPAEAGRVGRSHWRATWRITSMLAAPSPSSLPPRGNLATQTFSFCLTLTDSLRILAFARTVFFGRNSLTPFLCLANKLLLIPQAPAQMSPLFYLHTCRGSKVRTMGQRNIRSGPQSATY